MLLLLLRLVNGLSCHGVVVEGVGAFAEGGVDAEVGIAVGEGACGAEPEYC